MKMKYIVSYNQGAMKQETSFSNKQDALEYAEYKRQNSNRGLITQVELKEKRVKK